MSITNRYETIMIMTPVLSEDQHRDTVSHYKNFITQRGSSINAEEDWRLKKLAYPIKKKTTGYYFLLDYNAPPAVVPELEVNFKRDEKILRFLTVQLDKDAIEFIERKRKEGKHERSKPSGKKKSPEEEMMQAG